VPAWYEKTQGWVRQGKLVVIGIAQEQHPDRCRLFAQWHQVDWPILHDPINLMQVRGVPIEVAIDEHGIVRSLRPDAKTLEKEFLDKTFAPPEAQREPNEATRPDLIALRRQAEQTGSFDAWRELGDALVLWDGSAKVDHAINAYAKAIQANPKDGAAHFRLGVCHRMRYESDRPSSTDFQMAVDHWTKAREIEPNQYIWRRRVEQYGPRLTKPYPFYDWVNTAANDVRARGDRPVELKVLPTGSEFANPARSFETKHGEIKSPDPGGRIFRDTDNLIRAEVAIVPPKVKPGEAVRVHLTLRPNEQRKAHWNNEAQPTKLWVDPPPGWQVQPRLLIAPQGNGPETVEPRSLEFEVRAARDASGPSKLAAYALYYVCEDAGGTCRFLRQDIPIMVTVGE